MGGTIVNSTPPISKATVLDHCAFVLLFYSYDSNKYYDSYSYSPR